MFSTGAAQPAIIARLIAAGTDAGNRVHIRGSTEKEPTRPYIMLNTIAGQRVEASGGFTDLARELIQVDAVGETRRAMSVANGYHHIVDSQAQPCVGDRDEYTMRLGRRKGSLRQHPAIAPYS